MDIDESPSGRAAHLPRFSSNQMATLPPPSEETTPAGSPDGSPATATSPYGPASPKPDLAGTRTATSSPGKADREQLKLTGELVVALLGGLAVAAAAVVRWRTASKRRLREPTNKQLEGIGEPLGRILARHVDPALLNPDLADAIMAGAGVGRYLNDGPVLLWDRPDPGLPPDLNQPEES